MRTQPKRLADCLDPLPPHSFPHGQTNSVQAMEKETPVYRESGCAGMLGIVLIAAIALLCSWLEREPGEVGGKALPQMGQELDER